MTPVGLHSLVEFRGCDTARLADREVVRQCMLDAVRLGGGTIVAEMFHAFSPHGVSGVVVITESHVTIHTWPELGYAAVDVFSCSPSLSHESIVQQLQRRLGAATAESRTVERG